MRMLVAGVSEHLSVTLIDEGLGWHFSNWHRRRHAAPPPEPSAVARAQLFPAIESALGYFRQLASAARGREVAPAARDAVAAGSCVPRAPVSAPSLAVGRSQARLIDDPAGVFAWVPEAAITRALESSWNLGLAIAAIEGHRAGFRIQLMNGGLVYVVAGRPAPC